jgi:signal transduction histidine kinase
MSDATTRTTARPRRRDDRRAFEQLEQVFAEHLSRDEAATAEVLASARRRLQQALDRPSLTPEDAHSARLVFATEILAAEAIELASDPAGAAELIARIETAGGLSHAAVARELLRAPGLLKLSPNVASEVQLGLLMGLAPLRDVSLWTSDDAGPAPMIRMESTPSRPDTAALARRLLNGQPHQDAGRGALIGLVIEPWEQPRAALIARAEPRQRDRCLPVLEEAVPMLGAILERRELAASNLAAARQRAEAHERRLVRLALDIHDGPLQDLSFLGEDLRELRRKLTEVIDPGLAPKALGRLDDLDAQLVSVDNDLRRISASLQSPFLTQDAIGDALTQVVETWKSRSGIDAGLGISGDLDELTTSQQLALLSIVREALNNVREHSQATAAEVSVTGRRMSIEAQIVDDGIGFNVEDTLVRAAREGRLGLVGLHERARLLGGASRIESQPGGPTTISVTLPRWVPDDA